MSKLNILITGGSSGLGEAITRKLASNQNNFINFTYNKSEEKAHQIEKQLNNTKAYKCDFKDQSSIINLQQQMKDMNLDVIINNAVCNINKKHFHKIEPQDFMESYKCNVLPVIMLTQEAITQFRKKKSGKIINILTDYIVNKPPIGMAEYTANKAYIQSLSKSWVEENTKYGITVNNISPSTMLTNLTGDIDERMIEKLKQQHPQKKLLTPDETAETVEFLVTCTSQINGINLIINGGRNVI